MIACGWGFYSGELRICAARRGIEINGTDSQRVLVELHDQSSKQEFEMSGEARLPAGFSAVPGKIEHMSAKCSE